MGKNCENRLIVDFDSSKEASSCTECNAKNLSSLQSTVFEKIKKNCLKLAFLKKGAILPVFLDFIRNGILQRAKVFVLHSVHQDASFELSKSTIGQVS